MVANVSEPQDQGGVELGEVPEGAGDPDNLEAIPDEELEGLEEVEDPGEQSKLKPCKCLLQLIQIVPNSIGYDAD